MSAVLAAGVSSPLDIGALRDTLTRVHLRLMNHPETRLYASVILLGKNEIVEDGSIPTACTDGINKMYGAEFLSRLSEAEVGGLILHENIHVLLKHLPRHRDLMKEDPRLTNIAMDFVDNLLIDAIKDKAVATLPPGALLDRKYKGWSVREVYNDLRKQQEEQQKNGGKPGDMETLDGHDFSNIDKATAEEIKKLSDKIDGCLQQTGLLAGIRGDDMPRALTDVMETEVDWLNETREFASMHARGREEATFRHYNRKMLALDLFYPSTYKETIDEMIVACDLSGSVSGDIERKLLSEVTHIAAACQPKRLRVLWWDTNVRNEQVFEDNFDAIATLLRPRGGGGTRVSCVSQHIVENNINAECMIVLTDGHVENNVQWDITIPTLWLITHNREFVPPTGGVKVNVNN